MQTDHDWQPFSLRGYVPMCFPEHIVKAVRGYLVRGDPMGGYLTALFDGRSFQAVCSADPSNFDRFAYQMKWIAQCVPTGAFGSPEKMASWIEAGGLTGLEPGWKPLEDPDAA